MKKPEGKSTIGSQSFASLDNRVREKLRLDLLRIGKEDRVPFVFVKSTDSIWEGGWNLVDKARVVIYSTINPRPYWVSGQVTDTP